MRKEGTEIVWEEEDFQDHPDLKAISLKDNPNLYADREIVEKIRHGRGYVLDDGDYIFPGDQHITRLTTCH